MIPAKPKLTQFKDEIISEWHRSIGWHYPAVDIDFLLVEYDSGKPKALIEYKHENCGVIQSTHPTYKALRELCALRTVELPFFIAKYSHDCTQFQLRPMNIAGWQLLSTPVSKKLSESEFVGFLTKVRKGGN